MPLLKTHARQQMCELGPGVWLRGLGAQEGGVYGVMPSLQLPHVISRTRFGQGWPWGHHHRPDQARPSCLDRKSPRPPFLLPGTMGSKERGRLCCLSAPGLRSHSPEG